MNEADRFLDRTALRSGVALRCFVLLFVIVSFGALIGGCGSLYGVRGARSAANVMTVDQRQQLTSDLAQYANFFEDRVADAAEEIRLRSDRRDVIRNATLWKLRAVEHNRRALNNSNPVAAMVDAWALALRMENQLIGPDGIRLFDESAETALRSARLVRVRIEGIAMQALGEEAFLDLNDEVFAAAIRRPLVGIFEEVPENGIAMQGTELISSVITLPLAPLRTFGKVNETADSIREFNRIAERFADIVEDTPREARWQLELFAHTLEEKDSVTSAVLALDRASLEVARLRELIEEAPELSRAVVRAAAEETTRALPAVRQTIDEARQLVRETDALTAGVSARLAEASVTLNDAERAAKSLDSLALTLQTTLDKTDALATRLGLGQPRTTDPSARPFDLRDLEAAARAIEAAVMQINDALDRSDAILGSNQLDARLDDGESRARRLAEETGVIVRHTVDQILWRLFVGTIALIIIALLGTAALMRLRRG